MVNIGTKCRLRRRYTCMCYLLSIYYYADHGKSTYRILISVHVFNFFLCYYNQFTHHRICRVEYELDPCCFFSNIFFIYYKRSIIVVFKFLHLLYLILLIHLTRTFYIFICLYSKYTDILQYYILIYVFVQLIYFINVVVENIIVLYRRLVQW